MKLNTVIAIVMFLALIATSCEQADLDDQYLKLQFSKVEDSTTPYLKKIAILDSLNNSLQQNTNDSRTRDTYFRIAKEYFYLDQDRKYKDLSLKLVEVSDAANDSLDIAKALYYVGDFYENKFVLDSAYNYYVKSYDFFEKKNDTINIGRLSLYKAGILYDAGIFSEAEIENSNAIRFLIKTNDNRLKYESYNLMAITLKELGEFEKSLEYFKKALQQIDLLESENYSSTKISRSRLTCSNNIGGVYEKKGDYKTAMLIYRRALKFNGIQIKQPQLFATLKSNYAYSCMKIGIMNNVEENLLEALKIRENLNLDAGTVSSKIALGEYYLLTKDFSKGICYLEESYKQASAISSNYDMLASLKMLSENDVENRDFYSKQYIELTDKITDAERTTKNKFARIAFETEQAEKEIQLLSREKILIIIVAFVVITLLASTLIIFKLRIKNTKLKFIQKQQQDNEKIYLLMINQKSEAEKTRKSERDRIAMELHDGIINRIFTTRFNLMQLQPGDMQSKEALVRELQDAEQEIRQVSKDLQENLSLSDKSFEQLVSNLVQSQKNDFNTTFKLTVDKYIDWESIPRLSKINIYRIIQECLQNVNKHSQAKNCIVLIFKNGKNITLRIHDDGVGLNPKISKDGSGRKNIENRVKLLNASSLITSKDNKGTIIEIVF